MFCNSDNSWVYNWQQKSTNKPICGCWHPLVYNPWRNSPRKPEIGVYWSDPTRLWCSWNCTTKTFLKTDMLLGVIYCKCCCLTILSVNCFYPAESDHLDGSTRVQRDPARRKLFIIDSVMEGGQIDLHHVYWQVCCTFVECRCDIRGSEDVTWCVFVLAVNICWTLLLGLCWVNVLNDTNRTQ